MLSKSGLGTGRLPSDTAPPPTASQAPREGLYGVLGSAEGGVGGERACEAGGGDPPGWW